MSWPPKLWARWPPKHLGVKRTKEDQISIEEEGEEEEASLILKEVPCMVLVLEDLALEQEDLVLGVEWVIVEETTIIIIIRTITTLKFEII